MNLLLKLKKELQKLLYILSKEQKLYGGIVFVCSLLGAFLEVLGVGIILPLVPVSYTHLDVYKRQVF